MKAEIERDFTLHELEKEREKWVAARQTAVEHTTSETVEAVADCRYRLDVLLDELIEIDTELKPQSE